MSILPNSVVADTAGAFGKTYYDYLAPLFKPITNHVKKNRKQKMSYRKWRALRPRMKKGQNLYGLTRFE